MMRMNVVPDAATLKDLTTYVKGLLREAVPKALAEKFAEEGWLEGRIAVALDQTRLDRLIAKFFRDAEVWETTAFREAINKQVRAQAYEWKARVEQMQGQAVLAAEGKINLLLDQGLARFKELGEDRVRQIVAEELRRRLADKP